MSDEERALALLRELARGGEPRWALPPIRALIAEVRREERRATFSDFADCRADYLATFLGGYKDERELEIFQHGMETVFNGIRALADNGKKG